MSQFSVAIVIQARMNSSRLPGKMMINLGGNPILKWVLCRVMRAKMVKEVVVATSHNKSDDCIVDLAKKIGVKAFRGSELDVLDRFSKSTYQLRSNVIVRVCADNPFIDPEEIDALISFYFEKKVDLAFNHAPKYGCKYADGFGAEIFSKNILLELERLTFLDDKKYREHITTYFYENVNKYKIAFLEPHKNLEYPNLRFDLDSNLDLIWLRKLCDSGVTINTKATEIVKIANDLLNEKRLND
ncbi:cytidylyltransferase domain-containing protein [Polynucleobacter sp. AP-Ainpum-60-G11]|uniref:cytidylyltransferase domain-containing protein n=1 Tax=Polynucleobacter sp. AP-Ainpum-60-G11 TaxID=2576926 RepID=UPI001BFE6BFA|nr:hypothetical protein [Polynucleobacter sp. AP-Ainpum-60-G11]QWE27003.1 spore coat biosynthesis protein F [Polynucleobacter sp. AP-Ainpum-60-G11]